MTFEANRTAFQRTLVYYVVLRLDRCVHTYSSSPCAASIPVTGNAKCYNTFPTCQDTANYGRGTKDYTFSSYDCDLPFNQNERPYVKSLTPNPTEIKDDKLAVLGRIRIRFLNEPDGDVGIDPYVTERTSTPGRFWHKLYARNKNYKGRPLFVYQGFLGDDISEYQLIFNGLLDNFKFTGNEVEIEGVDLIGDLTKIKVPVQYDIRLGQTVTTASTQITFDGVDADRLGGQSTGKNIYVKVEDEVMCFASSNYSTVTNIASNVERGFRNSTITEHSTQDKVTFVAHYGPGNPFTIMQTILTNQSSDDSPGGGIDTTNVDTAAFSTWANWFGTTQVTVEAFIEEEEDLNKVYFDLVNLMSARSWVGEDAKITISRNVPNLPGRTYRRISDTANIVFDSDEVDINEGSRYTRNYFFWSLRGGGDDEKTADYLRRNVIVNTELESSNFYGEPTENYEFTKFLHSTRGQSTALEKFVNNSLLRKIAQRRDARPILSFDTEMKDIDLKTGQYIKITSDVLETTAGNPITTAIYQITKRTPKGGIISYEAEQAKPKKICYIMSTATDGFTSATKNQQDNGGFITDSSGVQSDRTPGNVIF